MRALSERFIVGRRENDHLCQDRQHPVRDVDKFVAIAIKEMKDRHGLPKEKIESGKTRDGRSYFINEYPATKNYSQWERVAYIQLPKAVAYVVLSSRDESRYRKDCPALREALKSFAYLEPKSDREQP